MPKLKLTHANLKKLKRLRALQRQKAAARRATTRSRSPVRPGRAKIEPNIQPLYDTEGIVANSGSVGFFSRPIGAAAASGFNKTLRDTNMDTAGQLPQPRVHVVAGMRVIFSMVTGDTVASPSLSINPDLTDYFSTLLAVTGEAVFSFEIGTKTYVEAPVFQFPGNVGLCLVGHAMAETATATEAQWSYALFPRGQYYSTVAARMKIPSLQTFSAKISFPAATQNALISGGIKATVVLDGMQGREVM